MRSSLRCLAAASLFALPSVLAAQGLTVQSVVDSRFQGALGTIVNLAARMGGTSLHDIATTTSLQGHKLRTDDLNTGTIIDLDGERITSIDHKAKTYSSMTFAEMMAMMQQASDRAQAESRKNPTPAAKQKSEKNDSLSVKYKVAVDRTGEREKIAGFAAERAFVTITLEGEATPENGKTEAVGSMVFLLDQWISKSAPQMTAYSDFYKTYAQKMGREFRANAAGLQAAFATDPRLKEGMEAAQRELQKMSGISLRSTTYVVLVPANMPFDRKLALGSVSTTQAGGDATPAEKPKGRFSGLMGAVKAAAEDAAKNDNGKKEPAEAKQSTLMTLKDEVKSISTGPVSPDVFAPPMGYKEVKAKQR